jgi:anti-sigma factor (TIGR02949 family)
MSHEELHDLGCVDCLANLYEYVDGELTPEMAEAIGSHLAACAECLPHFQFERTFLAFIQARSELRSAPPALRDQILRRILADDDTGTA